MRYNVPNDDKPRTIPVGRVGENDWTELAFDVREWLDEIDGAIVGVAYQRAGEAAAYPLATTIEDGHAVVKLTAAETAKAGLGKIQLVIQNSAGVVAKSRIYTAACLASLDGSGEPPEEWRPFIDEVFAAAVRAETAAANADTAAEAMADRRFIGGIGDIDAEVIFDGELTTADYDGKIGTSAIIPIILGEFYRVTYDGVVYYEPCRKADNTDANGWNGRVVGNAILSSRFDCPIDNGLPFCFDSSVAFYTSEAGTHSVKLEKLNLENVTKIPLSLLFNSNAVPIYVFNYETGNYQSVSIGTNLIETYRDNFAVGSGNKINGSWSFVCNSLNKVLNGAYYAFASGAANEVLGHYGRVGGFKSHSEGYATIADGYRHRAVGSQATAIGGREHVVENAYAAAVGGISNKVTGIAAGTFAGRYHDAAGDASFIGGGKWNTTNAKGQAVVGYGNAADEDDIFEIGNGLDADGNPSVETNDEPVTRQNAFSVSRDGTATAQTAFKVGDQRFTAEDVAAWKAGGGGGGENVADLNGLELNADNDEDAYLDIVLTDTRPVVLKNFYIKLNNGAKLHFDYVNSYQTLHDDLGNYYTFYFNDLWPGTGIFVSVEYVPQGEHPFYIYAWRSV